MKRKDIVIWLLLLFGVGLIYNYFKPIKRWVNCVQQVSLFSTENTADIELVPSSFSEWSDFNIDSKESFICMWSERGCGFEKLLTGTEIKLDGYVVKQYKLFVDPSIFFRGQIEDRIVWLGYNTALFELNDLDNEEALKLLGLIDDNGGLVHFYEWECTYPVLLRLKMRFMNYFIN